MCRANAHLSYISRNGDLAIETDEGTRVSSREAQRTLLNDWHLETVGVVVGSGQFSAIELGTRSGFVW